MQTQRPYVVEHTDNPNHWHERLIALSQDHDVVLLTGHRAQLIALLLSPTTGILREWRSTGNLSGIPRPSDFGVGSILAAEQVLKDTLPALSWDSEEHIERRVHGKGVFLYPLGPVRADVAESLMYRLQVMGDEIIRLELVNGFKKRHIRELSQGKALADVLALAERVTGTSAYAHGLAYCLAVENALQIDVDPEVMLTRTIMAELERTYSHLGDLAALSVSTGLPVPQMEYLHHKESILRLNFRLFGHRYLRDVLAIGGIRLPKSFFQESAAMIGHEIVEILDDIHRIQDGLENTTSFLDRLHGAGTIPNTTIDFVRPVGPTGRSSGRVCDMRIIRPYLRYPETDLAPPLKFGADSYARFSVKAIELKQSLGVLRRLIGGWNPSVLRSWQGFEGQSEMTDDVAVGVGIVEAPRGVLVYRVMVNPRSLTIEHLDMATPSARNWYVVPPAMANKNILQDFPIIDASFNYTVAGWDG